MQSQRDKRDHDGKNSKLARKRNSDANDLDMKLSNLHMKHLSLREEFSSSKKNDLNTIQGNIDALAHMDRKKSIDGNKQG